MLDLVNFEDDKLHGPNLSYHENGGRAHVRSYEKGKLHGVELTYAVDGQLLRKEHHEHGLVHGVGEQWSREGEFLGRYEMRKGVGVRKSWFESGALSSVGFCVSRYRCWGWSWAESGELIGEDQPTPAGYSLDRSWFPDGSVRTVDWWYWSDTEHEHLSRDAWDEKGRPQLDRRLGEIDWTDKSDPNHPHLDPTYVVEVMKAIERCETTFICEVPTPTALTPPERQQ